MRRTSDKQCLSFGAMMSTDPHVLLASSADDDLSFTLDDMFSYIYRYFGLVVVLVVVTLSALGTPIALWILARSGAANPRRAVTCITRPVGLVTMVLVLWMLYPSWRLLTYDEVPGWAKILIILVLLALSGSWLSVLWRTARVNRSLQAPSLSMVFVGAEVAAVLYVLPIVMDYYHLMKEVESLDEAGLGERELDEILDDPNLSAEAKRQAQKLQDGLNTMMDDLPDLKTMVYVMGASSLVLTVATVLLLDFLPLPAARPSTAPAGTGAAARLRSLFCGS